MCWCPDVQWVIGARAGALPQRAWSRGGGGGRPGRGRAARSWCPCRQERLRLCLLQGNIVALVHASGDAEDEESDLLLNGLSHQSHLVLRAEGLATGFCRDVHGQVRRAGQHPAG